MTIVEQLPLDRKVSTWLGDRHPVSLLGPTCWSSSQLHLPLARGHVCVCGGGAGVFSKEVAYVQGFHRGHSPIGTQQSGGQDPGQGMLRRAFPAALVQTFTLACPCVLSLGSLAHNRLLEIWVPHSLASHLRSTESKQSSGRGGVFGPGTTSG